MNKQFVPYNIALKLKELGFDDECLGVYKLFFNGQKEYFDLELNNEFYIKNSLCKEKSKYSLLSECSIAAPLWQQAFDWFREKHGLFSTIAISGSHDYQIYIHNLTDRNKVYFKAFKDGFFTKIINFCYQNKDNIYEQARQACLEKLVEICKNK